MVCVVAKQAKLLRDSSMPGQPIGSPGTTIPQADHLDGQAIDMLEQVGLEKSWAFQL